MGSLKKLIKNDPIHSRSIEMKTYALDLDTILVEGWLKEDRFHVVYDLSGEEMAKGPVHHMVIRIKVGGRPLCILDAEAEMIHVPLNFCSHTVDTIQKVIGLEIKAGFTKKIRTLIGGVKGCTHLTHLLTVMGQAAFQGYAVHTRKKRSPVPHFIEQVENLEYLLKSCRAWAEDGPKMMRLKSAIENIHGDGGN